ncbi:hypothetical protein F5Y18DRAFT_57316 [Xylariaceae sp. FL1019]|nr:hypothetical protein F5Y18DRAFT_57316 [Xylariaceae sp. FL1019]
MGQLKIGRSKGKSKFLHLQSHMRHNDLRGITKIITLFRRISTVSSRFYSFRRISTVFVASLLFSSHVYCFRRISTVFVASLLFSSHLYCFVASLQLTDSILLSRCQTVPATPEASYIVVHQIVGSKAMWLSGVQRELSRQRMYRC